MLVVVSVGTVGGFGISVVVRGFWCFLLVGRERRVFVVVWGFRFIVSLLMFFGFRSF